MNTRLHVAAFASLNATTTLNERIWWLVDFFRRTTSIVFTARSVDGTQLKLDTPLALNDVLAASRVLPTNANVTLTHSACWSASGAHLTIQAWRDEPLVTAIDIAWSGAPSVARELAESVVEGGRFDFSSADFLQRAMMLPRIGHTILVRGPFGASFGAIWDFVADVRGALNVQFSHEASSTSLSVKEAERRAVASDVPRILIPRLSELLPREHRGSASQGEPQHQVPTYLREDLVYASDDCCSSAQSGRVDAQPQRAAAPHAGTEEIDLEAVRRRLGRELPSGFVQLSEHVSVDPEGPATIRTSAAQEDASAMMSPAPWESEQSTTVLLSSPADEADGGTALAPASKEVLAARAAHFGQKLTPVRVPDLQVEQYAELIATLEVQGANDATTLQRFGIFSSDTRRVLDDSFRALFTAQPEERRRFQAWLEHHQARLRREPGSR